MSEQQTFFIANDRTIHRELSGGFPVEAPVLEITDVICYPLNGNLIAAVEVKTGEGRFAYPLIYPWDLRNENGISFGYHSYFQLEQVFPKRKAESQ